MARVTYFTVVINPGKNKMQLTLYTDYSLRVLVYLSLNPERSSTISEIADFYQVSRNHLVKVVHNLSLKQHIISSRGKGGGLRLARAPELINIGAVIRDTEPNFHVVECFNGETPNTCVVEPICRLKGILGKASDQFLKTLDAYSIADIIKKDMGSTNIINLSPQLQDVMKLVEKASE